MLAYDGLQWLFEIFNVIERERGSIWISNIVWNLLLVIALDCVIDLVVVIEVYDLSSPWSKRTNVYRLTGFYSDGPRPAAVGLVQMSEVKYSLFRECKS